jgi:hypothetical protein
VRGGDRRQRGADPGRPRRARPRWRGHAEVGAAAVAELEVRALVDAGELGRGALVAQLRARVLALGRRRRARPRPRSASRHDELGGGDWRRGATLDQEHAEVGRSGRSRRSRSSHWSTPASSAAGGIVASWSRSSRWSMSASSTAAGRWARGGGQRRAASIVMYSVASPYEVTIAAPSGLTSHSGRPQPTAVNACSKDARPVDPSRTNRLRKLSSFTRWQLSPALGL